MQLRLSQDLSCLRDPLFIPSCTRRFDTLAHVPRDSLGTSKFATPRRRNPSSACRSPPCGDPTRHHHEPASQASRTTTDHTPQWCTSTNVCSAPSSQTRSSITHHLSLRPVYHTTYLARLPALSIESPHALVPHQVPANVLRTAQLRGTMSHRDVVVDEHDVLLTRQCVYGNVVRRRRVKVPRQ